MKKIVKNIAILMAVVLPASAIAQSCFGTVKLCPSNKKDGFLYNNQSVSGSFVQGDTSEIDIVVYKDMEYRLSFCSPNKDELNGKFEFKIVEQITKPSWVEEVSYKTVEKFDDEGYPIGEEKVKEVTKKRVYNKVDVVRFDNTQSDNVQEFIFQSDKTRKLKIKVFVPSVGGDGGSGLEAESYACVGFLMEHQPGEKTGFQR